MADTKPTDKRSAKKSPPARKSSLAEDLGKRDPFDLLEQEVYINMLRTVDLMNVELGTLFEQYELSNPLYNALRIVAGEQKASPDGITVGTISQRMVCRQPDTTRLIDRLESLGYVKRVTSDSDARKRMITITHKGSQTLSTLHPQVRQLHRRQFDCLSPAALEKLNKLLDKVRQNFSGTT